MDATVYSWNRYGCDILPFDFPTSTSRVSLYVFCDMSSVNNGWQLLWVIQVEYMFILIFEKQNVIT